MFLEKWIKGFYSANCKIKCYTDKGHPTDYSASVTACQHNMGEKGKINVRNLNSLLCAGSRTTDNTFQIMAQRYLKWEFSAISKESTVDSVCSQVHLVFLPSAPSGLFLLCFSNRPELFSLIRYYLQAPMRKQWCRKSIAERLVQHNADLLNDQSHSRKHHICLIGWNRFCASGLIRARPSSNFSIFPMTLKQFLNKHYKCADTVTNFYIT